MLGEYEMKPKNVVVLMGGISPEREISLRSGNAVARALKEAEFNVTCIDVKDEKIEELDRMDIDVAFIALHRCCIYCLTWVFWRRWGCTTAFGVKRDSIYWLRYKCKQAC